MAGARVVSQLLAWLVAAALVAAQPSVAGLAGVRLDDGFRLVGSDSSGLIATIDVTAVPPGMTAGNFIARIFNDAGKPAGEMWPFAVKSLEGPEKRWVLLETSVGTLEKSYAAMIKANTAVLHKGRNLPIDWPGRYEFVYLIGPSVKRGAFAYQENKPTAAGLIVGPFTVPSKQ
jgi:hypothetical protein